MDLRRTPVDKPVDASVDEWQARAKVLVAEQANNPMLWFRPVYLTEDILQTELRRLHAVIEGKAPEQCAKAVLD